MKGLIILLGTVAICSLLAVAGNPQTEIERVPITWDQAAQRDSAALYAELCASCHGVDAKGKGPVAPALAKGVPDLTRLAAENDGVFPEVEVRRAISGETRITAHGTREMPVWGRLFASVRPDWRPAHRDQFARARVETLTKHLRTIQTP